METSVSERAKPGTGMSQAGLPALGPWPHHDSGWASPSQRRQCPPYKGGDTATEDHCKPKTRHRDPLPCSGTHHWGHCWGGSVFSGLSGLLFSFRLPESQEDSQITDFESPPNLPLKWQVLYLCRHLGHLEQSREWASELMSTVSTLGRRGALLSGREQIKHRDSRRCSCRVRKNHLFPEPSSILLLPSADSHSTPKKVKCLEMRNFLL